MSQFRYEVWPVPGIGGTYEKKIAALRPDSASGTLYRRQSGTGQLSIPAGYDRLNEIITVDPSNHANDVASLIRVYRGTDLIQELLVPVSPNLVADQPATLGCSGIEAVMDWAVVECWDWDGTADFTSTVPDWIYGGRNLIPDLALGDLGSIREQWELWNDQTPGGTFTLRVTEPAGNPQDTNSLDFDATIQQIEGSNLTGNGLEGLSNVDDVTISGSGSSSTDPWVITFFAPPVISNLQVFDAGGLTSALSQTEAGAVDPSPVTVSQSIDASRNPNTHGTYSDPPIEVVTTPLDTGADWSLLVNATGQYAGSQIVLNGVTPGQTYQASIRVRPTITSNFTLVIHDQFENRIKTTTPRDVNLTAGSFQELSISDIQIPEGVTRVIMRVAVVDATPANIGDFYVNWQGAEFREGQAATTAGQILLDLLADAQTDHASGGFPRATIDFINAGFDATNDSGSVAWADSELSVNIPRGMSYRKVLDRIFGQLGYEWNLTPTSGTPGEWDLNVWNPDGRGTDWSSADTPSLLLGQGTLGGSATRQIPQANKIISEGAGQFTTRARNPASETTIGAREWYQADVSYRGSQAEEWTDKTLARFLDVSLQPRFEIADPPDTEWPIPVVDYGLADILNVDLADGAGKVSRTIEAISWRTEADGVRWGVHTGEAQFDSFPTGSGLPLGVGGGSQSGDDTRGSAAVAPQRASVALSGPVDEGVRRLLDQFDRLEDPKIASAFEPGGRGGELTVTFAASDASERSKTKADFTCSGTNDATFIQGVLGEFNNVDQVKVVLSEGRFDWNYNTNSNALDLDGGVINVVIEGMGAGVTILKESGVHGSSQAAIRAAANVQLRHFTIEAESQSAVDTTGFNATASGSMTAPTVMEGVSIFAFSRGVFWDSDYGQIVDCHINACKDEALVVDASFVNVHGVIIESFASGNDGIICRTGPISIVGTSINVLGAAFDNDGISDVGFVSITGSQVFADYGVLSTGSGGWSDLRIVNSEFDVNETFIDIDCNNITIMGCSVYGGPGQAQCMTLNVANQLSQAVVIVGNTFSLFRQGGISIDGKTSPGLVFADNFVYDIDGGHALQINDCSYGHIHDNVFSAAPTSTSNFDTIHLSGDSNFNLIHHNSIEPDPATDYGINVADSTCDCNKIVGNDLGDPVDYNIDAINDNGTDTAWKYPDDPVYGDNFTSCEPIPS